MKKLIPIILLALAACGPEIEPNTDPQLGCLTGIPHPGHDEDGNLLPLGEREFIRCSARGEVFKDWQDWLYYEWVPVDDCSQCH